MKKINIAELLKDCPKDMELDCTSYENVVFDFIDEESDAYPIHCYMVDDEGNRNALVFTKNGYLARHKNAKCVIFPKGKTTWEGFVPPCKFKDGDVVACSMQGFIGIAAGDRLPVLNTVPAHCILNARLSLRVYAPEKDFWYFDRLATEKEKEILFKAIKENGYSWNPETKTLEKLVAPRFKVGNRIRRKDGIEQPVTISSVSAEYYIVQLKEGEGALCVADQDLYELAPDKFDITTLDPFESRVLVRDNERQYWKAAFWGFFGKGEFLYDTTRGIYKQCIPYEGNEHLLGKTDDCDEFYKTWK